MTDKYPIITKLKRQIMTSTERPEEIYLKPDIYEEAEAQMEALLKELHLDTILSLPAVNSVYAEMPHFLLKGVRITLICDEHQAQEGSTIDRSD